MKIIKELGMVYPTETSKQKTRMAIYECEGCCKHIRISLNSVKRSGRSICRDCFYSKVQTKHGASESKLYRTWIGMKARCYNSNKERFMDYGGRGIIVCDAWLSSFEAFEGWSNSNGYHSDLTIDRINVNGNYEPDNCRWADKWLQAQNTKLLRKDNTSGYRGVYFEKRSNRWIAEIRVNDKKKYLGRDVDVIEAAKRYDNYILEHGLAHPINFP